MSELNLFQKLFSRKTAAPVDEAQAASLDAPFNSEGMASTNYEGASAALAGPAVELTGANTDVVEPQVVSEADLLSIPVLGKKTVVQHQRTLAALLALALLLLAFATFWALSQADKVTQQLSATGQALMQSQRLAKSVSQAMVGSAQAFPDVKESSEVFSKSIRALEKGDNDMRIDAVPADAQESVSTITPLMERAEKNAKTVLGQQKILTQINTALRAINRQSSDLLEIA